MVDPAQDDFHFRGHNREVGHNHLPDYGLAHRVRHIRDAKKLAQQHPFDSAGRIVEQVMANVSPGLPKSYYFSPADLTRAINRMRAKCFPSIDLATNDYVVNLNAVPSKNSKFLIVIMTICSYQPCY